MLIDTDKRVAMIDNAFITRTEIDDAHRSFVGSVYDGCGKLCELALRPGKPALWRQRDPAAIEIPGADIRLPGRAIYLGHYMTQYGHFLLESLSRFWLLERDYAFDWLVFQPFVHPLCAVDKFDPLQTALQCFSIAADKVVFADSNIAVDQLVVPMALVSIYESAHRDQARVYERLVRCCENLKTAPVSDNAPARIYLSRRRYRNVVNRSQPNAGRSMRERILARVLFNKRYCTGARVVNEDDVERTFAQNGFHVMFPEKHSFAEQIKLFRAAKVIAGFSGSALHNAVFMPKGGVVITLRAARRRRTAAGERGTGAWRGARSGRGTR
jgi:capsular polysaccharide biosynthesis protein